MAPWQQLQAKAQAILAEPDSEEKLAKVSWEFGLVVWQELAARVAGTACMHLAAQQPIDKCVSVCGGV
jgi:hypothetical protein